MMEFISIPLTVGIICAGIYGLFELFVRRKERLAIIEKINDRIDSTVFEGKLGLPNYMNRSTQSTQSFGALKLGCLLAGVGLGLLIGFFINLAISNANYGIEDWMNRELASVCFGASVLLFGGIGLIIAFVLEQKMTQKGKDDKH